MNERINQLANIWANRRSEDEKLGITYTFSEKALETFTELILIEVTDILSTYRGKVVFTDGAEYNYQHPIIAIRKHFGVEE